VAEEAAMIPRHEVIICGTVAGALGVTVMSETFHHPRELDAPRPAGPHLLIYLTPHQQHGGAHDDEPHRDSRGRVRIEGRTMVTSTSAVNAPVALATDVATDLRRVYVPVTIQGGGVVFGQERYRSA
jgi:hypothetical protein